MPYWPEIPQNYSGPIRRISGQQGCLEGSGWADGWKPLQKIEVELKLSEGRFPLNLDNGNEFYALQFSPEVSDTTSR